MSSMMKSTILFLVSFLYLISYISCWCSVFDLFHSTYGAYDGTPRMNNLPAGREIGQTCQFNASSFPSNPLLSAVFASSKSSIANPSSSTSQPMYCIAGLQCTFDSMLDPNSAEYTYEIQTCGYCSAFPTLCEKETLDMCNDPKTLASFADIVLTQPQTFQPHCIHCLSGSFCPAGTDNPFAIVNLNLCPAGYWCQQAGTFQTADVGYFALPGSNFEIKCTIPGTYCGPNAVTNTDKCPGGSYCPDPKTKILCPADNYCPPGSIYPRSCSAFSKCPEGTSKPAVNWSGFLVLGVLAVSLLVINYYVQLRQKAHEAVIQEQINKQLKKAEIMRNLKQLAKSIQATTNSLDMSLMESAEFEGFERNPQGVSISFQDLSLHLKGNKQCVLNGVTGEFEQGKLIAIMGPSGAGN